MWTTIKCCFKINKPKVSSLPGVRVTVMERKAVSGETVRMATVGGDHRNGCLRQSVLALPPHPWQWNRWNPSMWLVALAHQWLIALEPRRCLVLMTLVCNIRRCVEGSRWWVPRSLCTAFAASYESPQISKQKDICVFFKSVQWPR